MKAVVLEIKKNMAAVLAEDGTVQKIPDRGYFVGQKIVLPKAKAVRLNKLYRSIAIAAVCILIASASLIYASDNVFAYSTVAVDVAGTTIELKLNKRDEVISAYSSSLSDDLDVAALLNEIDASAIKRKNLSDVLTTISNSEVVNKTSGDPDIRIESGNEEHRAFLEDEMVKAFGGDSGPEAGAGEKPEDALAPAAEGEVALPDDMRMDEENAPGAPVVPNENMVPDTAVSSPEQESGADAPAPAVDERNETQNELSPEIHAGEQATLETSMDEMAPDMNPPEAMAQEDAAIHLSDPVER